MSRLFQKLSFALAGAALFQQAVFAFPPQDAKVPPKEPKDINFAEGIKFSATTEYQKEFTDAVNSSYDACKKYLSEHKEGMHGAIVSDIDETLLDNRPCLRPLKEWDWKKFDAWIHESKAPPLPTKEFVDWARKQGFAVFLITGRAERQRAATIENLVRDGIAYDGLYMRQDGDKSPAEDFKSAIRDKIEKMGFQIVVNIGDQYSDLVGGHSIDCEKVPNRIYFVR